ETVPDPKRISLACDQLQIKLFILDLIVMDINPSPVLIYMFSA
ncbi:11053_t:CDS:1, partial [Dentiscutata heterogama]